MPDWFEQNAPSSQRQQQPSQSDWFEQNTTQPQDTNTDQPGALGRFFSSLGAVLDPRPALSEYWHRGEERRKMGAAIAAIANSRGRQMTPEEESAIEAGMSANVANPMGAILPSGSEAALAAGTQAAQGDIAGALGTVTGAYGVAPAVMGGVRAGIRGGLNAGVNWLENAAKNANPVEQAALDAARNEGIPVPLGLASGDPRMLALQKATTYTPVGAAYAREAEKEATQGFRQWAGRLAERANPVPETQESSGSNVLTRLESRAMQFHDAADENYTKVWNETNKPDYVENVQVRMKRDTSGRPVPVMKDVAVPVNIQPLQPELKALWKRMEVAWEETRRRTSKGRALLQSIVQDDWNIPVQQAEDNLSGLKALTREGGDARVVGLAKNLIPRVQKLIDDTVQAKLGDESLEALQAGRENTRRAYEVEGILKKVPKEPVQAHKYLAWTDDTGIQHTRAIAGEVPDVMAPAGRAWLSNLFDKAMQEGGFTRARGLKNAWDSLGNETKKEFFQNPRFIQDLNNFFLAAKRFEDNPNPSGTAFMNAISEAMGPKAFASPMGAVKQVVGGGILAKMMYKPEAIRTMTAGLMKGSPTEALVRQLVRIMGVPADEERIQEYLKSKNKTMLPYSYAPQANQ